jgi:hypothetical protein
MWVGGRRDTLAAVRRAESLVHLSRPLRGTISLQEVFVQGQGHLRNWYYHIYHLLARCAWAGETRVNLYLKDNSYELFSQPFEPAEM